ncbi:MAG TPA: sulfatase [Kofleriaceae bacterium]|nr:sulfatase [Kofleriaceae bacterium]
MIVAVIAAVRSRIATAARWLWPSVACACVGALVGGAVEGIALGGAWPAAAAAGFLGLIALPALIGASVLGRGLYALWQPEVLAAELVEADGAAPRLAGWAGFLYAAALALSWALFQGTWLLAAWTAFKPLTLGYAVPLLGLAAALLLVALSRPGARLFTRIARAIDRRWRRGGRRRTLLRPRAILAGTAAVSLATAYALWRLMVRPRIGPVDTSILAAPAAALIATGVAHALWHRAPRRVRAIAGGLAAGLAAATLAAAGAAVRADPALTLEIWGDQPLAGLAIERVFDLQAIRDDLPLEELRPAARPGAAHPDIVLITIDTVRADRTPPYGGPADMPLLRDLAERGTVFERAYAPSNVTRRSIPSMLTGLHPNRVRGRVVGWALRVDPRHVLVAERLRAGGYETAGFMCCASFWSREARTGLARGLGHLEIEPDGAKLARLARAWLDARERAPRGPPLFVWMHLIEPHNWATGIADALAEGEKRKIYDRVLARADSMLLPVLSAFIERPADRAPIVIVTADHGEGLGDHGTPFHSTDLYNSNLHVPFVIAGPGIRTQRVPEVVSLTDLTPTILELAGFAPPAGPGVDGRSLADLALGRRAGNPSGGVAFAAMIKDRSNPGGITAIVQGSWKLIDNGVGLELYDLRADPAERVNVLDRSPGMAAQLRQLLRERQALARRSPFE